MRAQVLDVYPQGLRVVARVVEHERLRDAAWSARNRGCTAADRGRPRGDRDHPLGPKLGRRRARRAVVSVCTAGGMATAAYLERI